MSELEQEVDETTNVEEIATEEPKVDWERARLLEKYKIDAENFTEDDLISTLKRIEKAESKIVSDKKNSSISPDEEIMTKFDFELEKFIEKNPDVAEYRDEIAKIAKEKKLTLAQARLIVEADDKTIANRKKTTLSRVTDGDTPEPNTYSKEYLAKLDPKNPKDKETYNRIMDKVEAGKATLK